MQKYIHQLRQKPEHVRRRIAVGASAGITALVGVIWVASMATSGAFALGTGAPGSGAAGGSGAAPSADAFALNGTNVTSNFSQLVGAVGEATGATTSKPALTIIDGTTSSSFDQPAQPASANNTSATVISF